jgi:hypothetical protein
MHWYWNFVILGFIPALWLGWALVGGIIMFTQRVLHRIFYRW